MIYIYILVPRLWVAPRVAATRSVWCTKSRVNGYFLHWNCWNFGEPRCLFHEPLPRVAPEGFGHWGVNRHIKLWEEVSIEPIGRGFISENLKSIYTLFFLLNQQYEQSLHTNDVIITTVQRIPVCIGIHFVHRTGVHARDCLSNK